MNVTKEMLATMPDDRELLVRFRSREADGRKVMSVGEILNWDANNERVIVVLCGGYAATFGYWDIRDILTTN